MGFRCNSESFVDSIFCRIRFRGCWGCWCRIRFSTPLETATERPPWETWDDSANLFTGRNQHLQPTYIGAYNPFTSYIRRAMDIPVAKKARWWQLNYFVFSPLFIWGSFSPILTCAYFSDGLVQPPTRIDFKVEKVDDANFKPNKPLLHL